MLRNAVEQRAQNFFLRAARMNRSYAAQQICRPCARGIMRASNVGRALRQCFENSAHQFFTDLRKVPLQNLRDHTFDDVSDFVRACHEFSVTLGKALASSPANP
jgi:hypothetical protein